MVAILFTTALQSPTSLPTAAGAAGHVIVGFSLSFTTTLKLHVAVLLEGSVAV